MNVGRETPASETTRMTFEIKLSLWMPVYTPRITPIMMASKADTNTNSSVAGIRSAIKSETSLFS